MHSQRSPGIVASSLLVTGLSFGGLISVPRPVYLSWDNSGRALHLQVWVLERCPRSLPFPTPLGHGGCGRRTRALGAQCVSQPTLRGLFAYSYPGRACASHRLRVGGRVSFTRGLFLPFLHGECPGPLHGSPQPPESLVLEGLW